MRWLPTLLIAVLVTVGTAQAASALDVAGSSLQQGSDADLTIPLDGGASVSWTRHPSDPTKVIQATVTFDQTLGPPLEQYNVWLHIFDGGGSEIYGKVVRNVDLSEFVTTPVSFNFSPALSIGDVEEAVVTICQDLQSGTLSSRCGR